MIKSVKADILWTPAEEGGRKHILPVGMRYCPIISLENIESNKGLWSAVVINRDINGRKSIADISYLVDEAPYHLLKSGQKFLLYEAQQVVAEGVVM